MLMPGVKGARMLIMVLRGSVNETLQLLNKTFDASEVKRWGLIFNLK